MVFEAVVVDLLNKFLNQYIENLDTSQLKIGIWGGDVVLQDLKIKTTLFDDLNLPVRVQWGKLGKLALKIPWKNLYSSNVVVDIEELLMVVIPETEFKYDPVKEEKWENDKKQSRLKAVEEVKKRELDPEPSKHNDGFVEKLVSQIVKNIQIVIRNIHIRYEDRTTNINFPFSVGVTMSNLSAQTTSEGSAVSYSGNNPNENFICKIVNLSGLAIYWNSHSILFSEFASDKISKDLLDSIPTNDYTPGGFDYVFGPLSATAFAQINPKPELDGSNFTIPKFFVSLHLKEIDLAVTRNQFYDVVLFLQDFRRLSSSVRFRKYRPVNTPVIGNAREWWEFSYNCVVEDIRRRKLEWSWEYMKHHREMCKKYLELYKIKMTSKKVSSSVADKLFELEKKLNVFNILLLREQVSLEVERDNLSRESKSSGGSWFASWFGYGAETKPTPRQEELVKTIESVMTPTEKQKLYKAIGYDESAPRANYPSEFIEFQFCFHLDEIKVTIYDDESTPFMVIMTSSIKTVKLELEQRAEENSVKFVMAIGRFQVLGKRDTPKSDIPELVTSTCADTESLVDILLETKPINAACDQRIHVNARPLKIIYHAETINRVREIFDTGSPDVNLVAATSASLPVFQKITTMGLQYAIEKRNVIDVKVNILSSYIIVPYGGVYKKDKEMLVLLLGSLTIETDEKEQKEIDFRKLYLESTPEQDIFSTILSASYTNFRCELTGVQILLQLNGENWVEASVVEGPSPLRFLESTNLVVTIKKSLVTDDARIPKVIIEGQLPSLTFNFSEERFVSFAVLLCSIPSRMEGTIQSTRKSSVSAWSLQSFGTQLEKQFVHRGKDPVNKATVDFLQGIDLMSHFEMRELVVKVSKNKIPKGSSKSIVMDHSKKQTKVEEKFLNLRITKLEIELTNKTFETVNLVKLGGIEFQQYLGDTVLPFVKTKGVDSDQYLFLVEYINVNPKIPDFYTKREAIINRLTLNVTPLNVIFNQEAILAQLSFYNHIQSRLNDVKENCLHSRIVDAGKPVRVPSTETITTERKILPKGRKFRKKIPKKEVIDFFLDANLEEIVITVENDNEGLMEFTLEGGSVEISTQKSSTNLDFKLEKILLVDLYQDTLYTKIIESFDEQTLSSRITLFNSDYFGAFSSVDMSVEAEIGGLRFCFLNLFFSRAFAFLSAFHVQIEILKEGATVAAQKAKQNVMRAYQNTARVCINMKIHAPILIIPRKTCSYEVLFADLGFLTVKNQITELDYLVEEHLPSRPVIDTMKFHLQNLKLSRGILNLDMVTLDDEKTFLIPVTFELTLNRNLSTAWFKVIPELEILARLAAVHIKLTHYDLTVIFSVLKDNLSEGGSQFTGGSSIFTEEAVVTRNKQNEDTRTIYGFAASTKDFDKTGDGPDFYTTVKYMFFMDSFVFDAVVENNEYKDNTSNIGLARFVLETISLEGRLFSDGSIDMSMLLVSCLLDDTRPGKIGRLTRLMERTADNVVLSDTIQSSSINSMIEVAYKKNADDSFIDVKVYKFTLILSMEFLQKLGEFFTVEKTNTVDTKVETIKTVKLSEKSKVGKEELDDKNNPRLPTFTFNLLVEKPDIVIVENMDSVDADCLILHAEVVMKYRYAGSRKVISSTINDVEIYSCCFNVAKRKNTLSQVIKPFTISVAGSTPPDQGLHIDICFTEISIIINPSTVELVSKCYDVLMATSLRAAIHEKDKDYTDLWDVRSLKPEDQWFLKAEEGIDALTAISYPSNEPSDEKLVLEEVCLITIPLIMLYLNGSSGNQLKPLLLLKAGFQSQCHNWSSKMNIISSLNLQLQYYNKIVSTWEPIIEPVETQADNEKKIKHAYTPWEVNSTVVFDDEGYLDIEKNPKMSVTISCEEILPITLTKTGVEVLKDVIDTYTSAVTKGFLNKAMDLPPFIVRNETGFAIELLLNESDLQVCKVIDSHYHTVKLEPFNEVELQKKVEARGPKTAIAITGEKKKVILHIRAKSQNARSKIFEVPLDLTTKRYYPVHFGKLEKEIYGLVADISIDDSTTTVCLQSVVKIINYFETPITIHSLSLEGNVANLVGTVERRSSITLPFQSVYKSQKKLFFSVKGYTFSSQPFSWTDVRTDFNYSKLLHCDSRFHENYDPFFMQVEGEIEQIYFSNTTRRTLSSICYNIYLQPTVKMVNALPVDLIIICQGTSKDKTLRPGNSLQLTNVEPKGFSLALRIQDYLEREWSCKEKIVENPPEFLVWKFISYNGLNSEIINLGVHCTFMRKTAVYTIYSPYFMVNKTDLLLSYRFEGSQTVFHHPSSLKIPMMFSPTFKKFFSKKSAFLKVRHSEWSEKFPVDVAGSGGTIECPNPATNSIYKISVSIKLTSNGLTKVITFTPYYVLTNETGWILECQEIDFPEHSWLEIPKNACVPFWPFSKTKKKTMRIRPKGLATSTPPFAYDSTDSCLLRLNKSKYGGIFADIQATQLGAYITFSAYEKGHAPILIINYSDNTLKISELQSNFDIVLQPNQQILHAWVTPTGERQLGLSNSKIDKRDKIIIEQDSKGIVHISKDETIQYVCFLDGVQRILLFTDDVNLSSNISNSAKDSNSGIEVICRIQGIGVSLVNNHTKTEILYMACVSTGITWESKKIGKGRYRLMPVDMADKMEEAYARYLHACDTKPNVKSVVEVSKQLKVDFDSMRIIYPHHRDLRRMFDPGLWMAYRVMEDQVMFDLKLNRLQIDNQVRDCIFPVILSPVPPPKTIAALYQRPKPFFELSIVKKSTDKSGVDQFKYFEILTQEFQVKIDVGFLQQFWLFFAPEETSTEEKKSRFLKDLKLTQEPLQSHVEIISSQEHKHFYELLHFSPLKIRFSFSLAGKLDSGSLPPFMGIMLQTLGVTLTDVHDVIFRLSYFERKCAFLTNPQLQSEVISHYHGQFVRQAYVLLLGLDVIGNPYGLIVGIGEGVEAFFYEPFQGIVHGPSEFATGVAIGFKSLFGRTVGSTAGTLGKLTETLGKGLAVLSLDKEYQLQRMEAQHLGENIHTSMARGGRGLLMGVVEGVTGVVKKPIEGAKEEGVGGFFKGMGKGMMGLVTRPVTGVVDFASTSLNAVKRVVESHTELKQMRPPRFFRDDKLVQPYNLYEATGNYIFYAICKRKYCGTDKYEHHIQLRNKEVVILTNKRMILAEFSDLYGTWQEHMAIRWSTMPDRPHSHSKGIGISLPWKTGAAKKEKPDMKVLLISDPLTKEEMCKKMIELYKLEKENVGEEGVAN